MADQYQRADIMQEPGAKRIIKRRCICPFCGHDLPGAGSDGETVGPKRLQGAVMGRLLIGGGENLSFDNDGL